MIELIFAIVIIGISVMSLPLMTQVTNKGIENSLAQEAIFAGAAELMATTTAYWDENSMQDTNVSALSRVIDISADCDDDTRLRPGHINQPYHRRCLDSNTTVANNAISGVVTDLDDQEHLNAILYTDTTSNSAGYKETLYSDINVSILATNANVKLITVTVRNDLNDLTKVITVLKTQSANIGEVDYYKRSF